MHRLARFPLLGLGIVVFGLIFLSAAQLPASDEAASKPSPDQVLEQLMAGNARFVEGKVQAPHRDHDRLVLADQKDQGLYAVATILTCSDSRVPVEILFDAGIMDLFVIRVAGNVSQGDEIGTIEYGLAHVNTPLLMILGHTRCGAVNTVIKAVDGADLTLERNIPPLLAPIVPAVKKAKADHKDLCAADLSTVAVEQNVWQAMGDLFLKSPATRQLVKEGKVKAVGAVYDLATGKVQVLPEKHVAEVLDQAEKDPNRVQEAMAPLTVN